VTFYWSRSPIALTTHAASDKFVLALNESENNLSDLKSDKLPVLRDVKWSVMLQEQNAVCNVRCDNF